MVDSNTQQQYILKKLQYRFDKKLESVYSEYLRLLFESTSGVAINHEGRISKEMLLDEIEALEFENFKYQAMLMASSRDIAKNEESLRQEEAKIVKTRQQITQLSQQYRNAQVARKNKLAFNEIGMVLMQYQKREQLDAKMLTLENEIKEMEEKYNREMSVFKNRQRYLRASIAALKGFISQTTQQSSEQSEVMSFESKPAIIEDEGQIVK